jgi:hypothetical protein
MNEATIHINDQWRSPRGWQVGRYERLCRCMCHAYSSNALLFVCWGAGPESALAETRGSSRYHAAASASAQWPLQAHGSPLPIGYVQLFAAGGRCRKHGEVRHPLRVTKERDTG